MGLSRFLSHGIRSFSTATSQFRFCIVGAGPAGFYTADRLLKRLGQDVRVDLVDRLPTPFGLVRSGVAPDHQPTKNVINQFSAVALDDRVRFMGNVRLGEDVSLRELRERYHGVVLCMGAESDKKLGIPGEEGPGVFSARQFVWWYNGHPDSTSLPVQLSSVSSVAICGIGNVALDCARVLLRSPIDGPLAISDMASHTLDVLRKYRGQIQDVHLVARRGPVQAACTAKELKELVTEPGVHVIAPLQQMSLSEEDELVIKKERQKRRLVEIISQASQSPPDKHDSSLHFQFYRQPRKVVRDPVSNVVTGLEVEITRLVAPQEPGGVTQAVGTGQYEVIPAQMVLVSIGYRSLPVEGVPFDARRGVVLNEAGRVLMADTKQFDPGLYVCGWIKRGPSGIIGTNAVDAEETVSCIVQDIKSRAIEAGPRGGDASGGMDSLETLLARRGVRVVGFQGWLKIDQEEIRAGQVQGRVRDKVTSVERMLDLAA